MPRGSWATNSRTRNVMRGNRSRDTAPELAVRKRLHSMGLRYRVSCRPEPTLRRSADVVFSRVRVAVFIDGCYWHGCPEHYAPAKSNATYWLPKIEANRLRDTDTTVKLEQLGWRVLRYWSHEDPTEVAESIYLEVSARRNEPRPVHSLKEQ